MFAYFTQKHKNQNNHKLNQVFHKHPDIILLKQQIQAAEEIRNKQIDLNDTGETLKKCFE